MTPKKAKPATLGPICQCVACQGSKPVLACQHTAEMFTTEEMVGPRVARDAPASIAQRDAFDTVPEPQEG